MGITMIITGRSGKPERPSFFPIRAHLLTTCKAGGGIPPFGRAVRSSRSIRRMLPQRGQTMPQRISAVIVCAAGRRLSPCLPIRCKPLSSFGTTCHPPAKSLPQHKARPSGAAAFSQLWTMPPRTVHFLLPRQKKQNRPLQGAERK